MIVLRSSDFRLLHFVLLALKNIEPRKDVFEALRHFELLVETEEDAVQYTDDKAKKSFNSIAVMGAMGEDKKETERSICRFLEKQNAAFSQQQEKPLRLTGSDCKRCSPITEHARRKYELPIFGA